MVSAAVLDLDQLYRRYHRVVRRRVVRFVDEDHADEVVQEVFERVVRCADQFGGRCHPLTWLYRVTTRHCLNRLRDRDRRRELLAIHGQPAWQATQTTHDHDTALFLDALWRRLDEDLATIGVFHFVDGMSHADIARAMGCSPRTVGNRIAEIRALARRHAGEPLE